MILGVLNFVCQTMTKIKILFQKLSLGLKKNTGIIQKKIIEMRPL